MAHPVCSSGSVHDDASFASHPQVEGEEDMGREGIRCGEVVEEDETKAGDLCR